MNPKPFPPAGLRVGPGEHPAAAVHGRQGAPGRGALVLRAAGAEDQGLRGTGAAGAVCRHRYQAAPAAHGGGRQLMRV